MVLFPPNPKPLTDEELEMLSAHVGGSLNDVSSVKQTANENPERHSKSEVLQILEQVQKACGDALDPICQQVFMAAMVAVPRFEVEHSSRCRSVEFRLLAAEEAIRCARLGAGGFDRANSGACAAIGQIVKTALLAAGRSSEHPDAQLWVDAPAVFRDYLRIAAVKERSDDEKNYMRSLERVLRGGLLRSTAKAPTVSAVLELVQRFPNFSGPATFIAEQAALHRLRKNAPFKIPPILLLGPPGIGKTCFTQALAGLLASRVTLIGLSSQSNGWALSGLDRGWSSGRPGGVFEALADGDSIAPVVVLDEIDKANIDSRSDPLGPLYQLLEPQTAKSFRDEHVSFCIDASHVIWIATANDEAGIPDAIRSRFKIFRIEGPTESELKEIGNHVYQDIAKGINGAPEEMPESWVQKLNGNSIRGMQLAMQHAIGRAALRTALAGGDMLCLEPDDFPLSNVRLSPGIGFIR